MNRKQPVGLIQILSQKCHHGLGKYLFNMKGQGGDTSRNIHSIGTHFYVGAEPGLHMFIITLTLMVCCASFILKGKEGKVRQSLNIFFSYFPPSIKFKYIT